MIAVAVLLLTLSLPALSSASAPRLLPPPPPSCPDLTLIGARGSGESFAGFGGLGAAVQYMSGILAKTAPRYTIETIPDPYPADSVNDLKPSGAEIALLLIAPPLAVYDYVHDNVEKYIHSINTGISDAVSLAKDSVATCPNSKLVLAGYSQGAIVIHEAELRAPSNVRRRIVGTLLLADGDRVPYTHAVEFGTSAARAEGIRVYLHGVPARDVPHPASTANICDAGDLVCDFNLSRLRSFSHAASVHTSYAIKTQHGWSYKSVLASAATWLAKRIRAHG